MLLLKLGLIKAIVIKLISKLAKAIADICRDLLRLVEILTASPTK